MVVKLWLKNNSNKEVSTYDVRGFLTYSCHPATDSQKRPSKNDKQETIQQSETGVWKNAPTQD